MNGDTLGLLLGMMILSAYLGEAGFFRWASFRVLRAFSGPRTLLWGLVFTFGVLSALLVNDTVCLMVTPLVVHMVDDAQLPPLPYLLELAGSRGQVGFWRFMRIGAAVTAVTLSVGLAIRLGERALGLV